MVSFQARWLKITIPRLKCIINLYFAKAGNCDFAKMTMFVLSRSTEPHRLTTTMYCYLLLS